MKIQTLNSGISISILFLIGLNLVISSSFLISANKKERQDVNRLYDNPWDSQDGEINIDNPIINSSVLSMNSNDFYPISIPTDKVLQNISIENAQFNHTNQLILNPEFNNESQINLWTLNSTLNNIKGLSLNQTIINANNNSALIFQINGNNSWEYFTPFDNQTNKDEFESLNRWNTTIKDGITPADYNIQIDSYTSFPDYHSVKSDVITTNYMIDDIWGEINHSFVYPGDFPINSIDINISYAFETAINNSVCLSIWWIFKNGTRVQIENWNDTISNQTTIDYRNKSFQNSNLQDLIVPEEYSTIAILFNHTRLGSAPLNSRIWIDNIVLAINSTCLFLDENENISIEYETYLDSYLNSNPIFSFTAILNQTFEGINFSKIEFGIRIYNYSYLIGTLNELGKNEFQKFTFEIPHSIFSPKTIKIGMYFRCKDSGVNFNRNQSWCAIFDNVTFYSDTIVNVSNTNINLNLTSDNNLYDIQINPSKNGTQTNIRIQNIQIGWTFDQNLTMSVQLNETSEIYTLKGVLKLSFLTWRDFLFYISRDIQLEFNEFLTELSNRINYIPMDWSLLLEYKTIFENLEKNNIERMLWNAIEKDFRLGWQLISYLTFHANLNELTLSEQVRSIAKYWNQTQSSNVNAIFAAIFQQQITNVIENVEYQIGLFRQNLIQDYTLSIPNTINLGQIKSLYNQILTQLNQKSSQDTIIINLLNSTEVTTYHFSTLQTLENLYCLPTPVSGENIIIPWNQISNLQESRTKIAAGFPSFFSENIGDPIISIDMSISQKTWEILGILEILFQFTTTTNNINDFFIDYTNSLIPLPVQASVIDMTAAKLSFQIKSNENNAIGNQLIMGNQSLCNLNLQFNVNNTYIPWNTSHTAIMGQIWVNTNSDGTYKMGPQFVYFQIKTYRLNSTTIELPLSLSDSLYLTAWFSHNQSIAKNMSNPILYLWAEHLNQKSEAIAFELDMQCYSASIPTNIWRENLTLYHKINNISNVNITLPMYKVKTHIISPPNITIPLQWSIKNTEIVIPFGILDLLNSSTFYETIAIINSNDRTSLPTMIRKNHDITIVGGDYGNNIVFDIKSIDRSEFPWINIYNTQTKSNNLNTKILSWEFQTTLNSNPYDTNQQEIQIISKIQIHILPPLREGLDQSIISLIFWTTTGIIGASLIFFKRFVIHINPFLFRIHNARKRQLE